MMKKNIGIFIRDLEKGGAQKQSLLLALHLSTYYKTYLIVYHNKGEFIDLAKEWNINLICLTGSHFSKIFLLYKILKKENINVIINYLPLNNIIGIVTAKIAGIDRIFGGIRSDNISRNDLIFRIKLKVQKFICHNLSDGIISNSYAAKDSYKKYGFRDEKITVIHNLIDNIKKKNKNIPKDNNTINILSVGRFVPEKNYKTAIRSIRYLIDRYPETATKIRYNIVGYGELENVIRKLIVQYRLEEWIKIIDGKSNVTPWYENSDIYLMTSIFEGTPNTLLDAIIHGLPVVSTDVGDIRIFVINGYNGYLSQVNDYKRIAESLYELIINNKKRISMGQNGYYYFCENYSSKIIISKYRNLIEK